MNVAFVNTINCNEFPFYTFDLLSIYKNNDKRVALKQDSVDVTMLAAIVSQCNSGFDSPWKTSSETCVIQKNSPHTTVALKSTDKRAAL